MTRTLAVLLALLAPSAFAEVVDSNSGMVNRLNENAGNWQNDDNWSVFLMLEQDSATALHTFFSLARDETSSADLMHLRGNTASTLSLRSSTSTSVDTSAATRTANTWYGFCIRGQSDGTLTASWYSESGTLIEDLSGTDTSDDFTGATELAIGFGGRVNGSTGAPEAAAGEIALPTAWEGEDIGDAGCDAMAADPLNYAVTTNPATIRLWEPDGDMTLNGSLLADHSGNGKDFAFRGGSSIQDESGPTVTNFSADAEFTSGPTKTGATTSSVTIGFTTDIDATVYGVACNPGIADPTGAEVVAGLCDTGVPAADTCTESTVGGVADSCTLDFLHYTYDVHFVACPEGGVC